MSKKKNAPEKPTYDSETLTRSARKRLMRAVDLLISNFEAKSPKEPQPILETARSKQLDKSYERLRNAASTLNHWHTDEEYLTDDGEPKPLPWTGKISLNSLAMDAVGDRTLATKTADDLIEFDLVKKSGEQFIPNKRSAIVGKKSPLILAHATSTASRLMETIAHNVAGKKPSKYERQVAEVRISDRELPQFLRFTEQQGQYFIDSINDWLTARELPNNSKESGIRVGVGAFAWSEKEATVKKRRPAPLTRPRR